MNRRHLLTVSGAAVAGSLISLPTAHAAKSAKAGSLGLDLPPLPYEPAALEPHIDAMTMSIHHDKHHAAYVKNLGAALKAANVESTDPLKIIQNLSDLPADQKMAIRNNGGGHVNHSWFWNWMAPAGNGAKGPEGKLGEAIQSTFSSIDDFKKTFGEAATKRFGSGWAWLIVTADGKLAVTSTPNQDNPLMKGVVPDKDLGTPILGLDVWEHAYYLKYQNKRPDYIAAWWNVVNWAAVAKGYDAAKA
jgi:Fe-Mn family superoxide dismutase